MTVLMVGPLIDVLHVRTIHAYEVEDVSALPGLRRLGAVMALHGIAMNGGLVGGGIESLFLNDRMHAVDDAIEGFQWLGFPTGVSGSPSNCHNFDYRIGLAAGGGLL